MSGFVSTAAVPTDVASEDRLENDGWFPEVSLSQVRSSIRVDGTVVEARLRDAVLFAMSDINDQLVAFKALQQAAGAETLEAVSPATLGGVNRLVLLYRRAVCATVSAEVMERYRNFDSSGAGERRADDSDPAIAEQMRNARWAVRSILGKPHATVELI